MKPIPHQHSAEAAILGAVLLRPETLPELPDLLPEHFHQPAYRAVWAAMRRLADRGEGIDVVTLEAALRASGELGQVGGLQAIGALADAVATHHGAQEHARLVIDAARVRRLRDVALRIAEEACQDHEDVDAWVDRSEQAVLEVSRSGRTGRYRLTSELVMPTFQRVVERAQLKSEVSGLRTYYVDLDSLLGGLQPGDLIILAARPSAGKTALALNIAENVIMPPPGHEPVPCLFFSLEMSAGLLVERLMVSRSRLDSARLRAGKLTQMDFEALARASDRIYNAPLAIDDTSSPTVLELAAGARRWRTDRRVWKGQPFGLIVVDYLQLVRGAGPSRSREQEISSISRALKAMAKELEVPVLCLSQLNRANEARADKRPQLSDLRESGAIEQDSDVVLFVHREERFAKTEEERLRVAGQAEIIVGKARNGPCGTVHMTFLGQHTRFESAANGVTQ